jgi:hypothetical protein
MSSVAVGLCAAVLAFACGVVGLFLQRKLPEHYTKDHSRDMISAVVGLVTLLSALVMGLLIWTSYGVYTAQRTAVQTFASQVLQLDRALAELGPEAASGRAMLKDDVARTHEQFWGLGNTDFVARNYEAALTNLQERRRFLSGLHPTTDLQKQALSTAQQLTTSIGQTRLLLSLQLDDPVSWPLLSIVVSWVSLLFCGFGLMSRINSMTVCALGFGALAVGSAAYLIVDLSEPYSGLFRVSPAALERVAADLGK